MAVRDVQDVIDVPKLFSRYTRDPQAAARETAVAETEFHRSGLTQSGAFERFSLYLNFFRKFQDSSGSRVCIVTESPGVSLQWHAKLRRYVMTEDNAAGEAPERVVATIKKCFGARTLFVVIPLLIHFAPPANYLHQNVLVYDTLQNSLFRFESQSGAKETQRIDIHGVFKTFLRIRRVLTPPVLSQMAYNDTSPFCPLQSGERFCVAWAMWWLEIRLRNSDPGVPRTRWPTNESILEYFQETFKGKPRQFVKFYIARYSELLLRRLNEDHNYVCYRTVASLRQILSNPRIPPQQLVDELERMYRQVQDDPDAFGTRVCRLKTVTGSTLANEFFEYLGDLLVQERSVALRAPVLPVLLRLVNAFLRAPRVDRRGVERITRILNRPGGLSPDLQQFGAAWFQTGFRK